MPDSSTQASQSPAGGMRPRTSLVTLVFTDMVNSTALKQQFGDRGSSAYFDRHHEWVRQILAGFSEGREIETAGDSFLLDFSTPSAAVQFAIALQSKLASLRAETGADLSDRIGIHLGEVVIKSETSNARPRYIYGIQIDICSRVMSLARGGQILMTQAVFDSARQVLKGEDTEMPLEWLQHGPYLLKGIEEAIEICEVRAAGADTGGRPASTEKAQRRVTAGDEVVLGWRPAIGQVVPGTRWVLEEKLGEGGFGEVWLGCHPITRDTRVFKFCFQAERVRYLKRELTLFRVFKERVGHHPHVVRLYDVSLDHPPFYVEMDHVAGKDLRHWSETRGGIGLIPLEERLEIVAQAAEALQAAHDAGIIHRDVKPANILIATSPMASSTHSGRVHVKLTDFGIGQVVSEEYLQGITRAGFTQTLLSESSSSHTGTQIYMAPELLAGQAASARSDIYSLAVVLFQMLAGSFSTPVTSDWAERVDDPLLQADLKSWLAGDPQRRPARASELAEKLRSYSERTRVLRLRVSQARSRQVLRGGAITAAALAVILAAGYYFKRSRDIRWATEIAIPEATDRADANNYAAAFELLERAAVIVPDNPVLTNLLERVSTLVTVASEPSGAEVSVKEYLHPEHPWRPLGNTPIQRRRIPRGHYRWRIAKAGFEMVERADNARTRPMEFRLTPADSVPAGMIGVSGGAVTDELIASEPVELADFYIDRFEVSNRQFKDFVDQGAYRNTNHWLQAFIDSGQSMTWNQAMLLFKDETGLPGPATWSNGTFPAGHADFPVTGVSWYEAAAYAHFVGKELPSVFHWQRAAHEHHDDDYILINPAAARLSNFSPKGLAPAGAFQGMSPSGVFDMAGNAREWCWNTISSDARALRGGAWSDPAYMFYQVEVSSPFHRSASTGFRCIKRVSSSTDARAFASVTLRKARDYANKRPVSTEVYQAYRRLFQYEKTALKVRVERLEGESKSQDWTHEKVSFEAPESSERIPAHIFLPKRKSPPYQTVIIFPHAVARGAPAGDSGLVCMDITADLLNSGRAVIHPIFKGTYERSLRTQQRSAVFDREFSIEVTKEFLRAVDYLESRSDIDLGKLGYVGLSWGAVVGPRMLALDSRVKAAVWASGGLPRAEIEEVVDPFQFAPHVTIPVLMLNGRFDAIFPLELYQRPLYEMLGTRREDKRHVVHEGGHELPRLEIKREMLAWFDKYLGPVN